MAARSFLFYIPPTSPFLKLNPLSKISIVFAVSILALVKLKLEFNLIVMLISLFLLLIARVPLKEIKSLLYGFAFMVTFLMIMYSLLSRIPGERIYLTLPWGTFITENTFKQAAAVAFRMLSLIFTALLFLSTTSDKDIILALQSLKFPYSICFMVSLAIRSISMFADDWKTILDAYWSKGVDLNAGNIIVRLRNYVKVIIPLIMLTLNKIREIDFAAESRGFKIGLRGRTRFEEIHWSTIDYLTVATSIISVLIPILYFRLF